MDRSVHIDLPDRDEHALISPRAWRAMLAAAPEHDAAFRADVEESRRAFGSPETAWPDRPDAV